MAKTLIGTIECQPFGPGTWALVTAGGETYELFEPKAELQVEGLRVKVHGNVRKDVMTLAMIGPVFEVERFERL